MSWYSWFIIVLKGSCTGIPTAQWQNDWRSLSAIWTRHKTPLIWPASCVYFKQFGRRCMRYNDTRWCKLFCYWLLRTNDRLNNGDGGWTYDPTRSSSAYTLRACAVILDTRYYIILQLANRCQHLSVFSTTNIPLLGCYINELTYREYITTSSLYGK